MYTKYVCIMYLDIVRTYTYIEYLRLVESRIVVAAPM